MTLTYILAVVGRPGSREYLGNRINTVMDKSFVVVSTASSATNGCLLVTTVTTRGVLIHAVVVVALSQQRLNVEVGKPEAMSIHVLLVDLSLRLIIDLFIFALEDLQGCGQ